jgi:hypothetical protein
MTVRCFPQDPATIVVEYHWRHNDHPVDAARQLAPSGESSSSTTETGRRRGQDALDDNDDDAALLRSTRRRLDGDDSDASAATTTDDNEDDDDAVNPAWSVANTISMPLQREVRRELYRLVELHMDWQKVKDELRLGNQTLDQMINTLHGQVTPLVPNSTRIKYYHVHYAFTKALAKKTHLASKMHDSLALWGQRIEEQDGHVLHWQGSAGIFVYAFMSKWQMEVYSR